MKKFDIGVYGLGVMGSSLAKNIINKGFSIALYSKNNDERDRFNHDINIENWEIQNSEVEFILKLNKPRKIFLMITSGNPVDLVIESILPLLDEGDIIMDGGNSFYKDTVRRCKYLADKGIKYLGVGVSGGEKGALEGPSIMVGGDESAWPFVENILRSIAAKYQKESCCGYIGKEGSGHYVKMVHNGIEYAILQQIADIYHIMKYGLNLSRQEIINCFKEWKYSEISSYLIDITVTVLEKDDEDGQALVDKILDIAKMKGTGNWTFIDGIERGVYIPSIGEAVFARSFSGNKRGRELGSEKLSYTKRQMNMPDYRNILKEALYMSMICSYAQGIELIKKASIDMSWDIDLVQTVFLWREGCIIRSGILNIITKALISEPDCINIILTEELGFLEDLEPYLRHTVISAQASALAVPTLISALNYYDSYGTNQMSVNIVQALRDCFGAHTYERVDKEGTFHTAW